MPEASYDRDEFDYIDRHYVRRCCVRPGDLVDSSVWDNYVRLLAEPFVDYYDDPRYCNEDELHEIVDQVWQSGGAYDEVTIEHEAELAVGTHAARGSRIDFLAYHDDGHRTGIEVKTASLWTADAVQDQLVRYARTGRVDSLLLLTADPELTEIDWPRDLTTPLFMVLLGGRRGRW
ncbi:hypothetical protein IU438_27310 [Nocardia cyriacigeorgica]|uniref:hypothetical protein n=1 Tax=Nocardia cyriacigeorgica TaxID=135487 RepID=UPI0018948DFC|nr:hypothetical protein [Nocardia cyriacigeorgica]MBF6399484.1 hypothetical protein [Nocardia cyriacigeorgica]MBF6405114.1 hypothetical protein [Nocardia cyriacigeorgica]